MLRLAKGTPLKAKLLDSVPQDVKIISSGVAPISAAVFSRATESASSASSPNPWIDEGIALLRQCLERRQTLG